MAGCVASGYHFQTMPYQSRPGGVYLTRIRNRRLSCGTTDRETALDVERFAKWLARTSTKARALELVLSGEIPLAKAFDYHHAGRLDDLLVVPKADPDLSPMVDQWAKNPKYVAQVRRLIPAGVPFPASRFGRKAVSTFVDSLAVTNSTKNRYRAALSQFGRWLVEREVLDHNPVRDVQMRKPEDVPIVWLELPDAMAVIAALELPYRAAEALMVATGMESQAVRRLRRKDVDLDARTARAWGSKNKWRNRVCRGTQPWAWGIFADYACTFTPNAPLFAHLKHWAWLSRHYGAIRAVRAERITLHGWRHTYAVLSLREGLSPTVVARQLGHRDAHLVHTIYGRFIPDERDYATHATRRA